MLLKYPYYTFIYTLCFITGTNQLSNWWFKPWIDDIASICFCRIHTSDPRFLVLALSDTKISQSVVFSHILSKDRKFLFSHYFYNCKYLFFPQDPGDLVSLYGLKQAVVILNDFRKQKNFLSTLDNKVSKKLTFPCKLSSQK